MTAARSFDVLVAADCRVPGDSSTSVVEEIRAQVRAGYRTGLAHLPSPALSGHRPFAPQIRQLVDRGEAELVLPGDQAQARLLVARNPAVFAHPPAELPGLVADQAVVVVNTVLPAARRTATHDDVRRVQRTITHLTGATASWSPTGPAARTALAPYAKDVPLLEEDWENVIATSEWQAKRDGFVSDRPVIGRHGRDHWSKWPRSKRDLTAAYPSEPPYVVRVLGGTGTPERILGRLPANWQRSAAGSMPAPEFLATIDFLVYFHHPRVVESFGRIVLEGLAAGAVPIVPRYMQPLFGDACLYGEPADVLRLVDDLYGNWEAYAARSQAAVETAQRRFGPHRHIERISRLIGSPSTAAVSPAPPQPREHGTLIIDLTRGQHLSDVVSSVVRAAVNEGGPRVAALPAARAADLDGRVPAETFPRVLDELPVADRRKYLQRRIEGLVRTHQPSRVLVVDDGHSTARELLTGTLGGDADIWHIQPVGPSAPVGDVLAEHVAAVLPRDWGITRMAPRSTPAAVGAAPSAGREDLLARLGRSLRRRAQGLISRMRRWLVGRLTAGPARSQLMLFEVDEADLALPVRTGSTHQAPSLLPATLIVVTGDYGDPHRAVRAITERQQMTGSFRAALLAPPEWEPVAAAAGLTVETVLPESTWTALYGSGWQGYLRARIAEACRAIGPATVVHTEGAFNRPDDVAISLDIIESARVRRPAAGEAP